MKFGKFEIGLLELMIVAALILGVASIVADAIGGC